MLEGVTAGNVVDDECASSAAVVRASDASEGLLAGRVPYLNFNSFFVNGDNARAELDTDSQVVSFLEALVRELEKKARLANSSVTDDDVLEKEVVTHFILDQYFFIHNFILKKYFVRALYLSHS